MSTVTGTTPVKQAAFAEMATIPGATSLPDWSQAILSRIVPPLPERSVIRSPETRLVAAILHDAQQRCVVLAGHRRSRRRFRGRNADKCEAAYREEEAELRDWLASTSEARWSLRWDCAMLEATMGVPIDPALVSRALLGILDGEVVAVRAHRSGNGGPRHIGGLESRRKWAA